MILSNFCLYNFREKPNEIYSELTAIKKLLCIFLEVSTLTLISTTHLSVVTNSNFYSTNVQIPPQTKKTTETYTAEEGRINIFEKAVIRSHFCFPLMGLLSLYVENKLEYIYIHKYLCYNSSQDLCRDFPT